MLPCGCYGCVKVKKCMKTQFSIYNLVYIIVQVYIYIYYNIYYMCKYPFLAVRRYTLKVRMRLLWKYMDFK